MSDLASDLEQEVQEAVFSNTAPTIMPVDNVYLALHTGDPGDDASANEVTATDYTREQTSPSDWTVSGTGPTVAENNVLIQYDRAENNWGVISHVSAWDSETGGNALWKGALTATREIEEDDRAEFEAEELKFELD